VNQTPSYDGDFQIFETPERTHETITAAAHHLEEPTSRLIDEAVWFDTQDPIDMAASSALRVGQPDQANMIWDEAANQSSDRVTKLHYQRNSAVLSLCMAEIPSDPKASTLVAWRRALASWTPLLEDKVCWIDLVSRSPAKHDVRCPSDAPLLVRAAVGNTLAARISQRAVAALRANRADHATAWIASLQATRLPREFLEAAFADVLDALAVLIRAELAPIQIALRGGDEEQADLKSLESDLLRVRTILKNFGQLASQENSTLEGGADLLAEGYRTLALRYATQVGNLSKSLELLEIGRNAAGTEGLRVQLAQDTRQVRWLMAAADFRQAHESRDHVAAQRAFGELERNCSTDENTEAIESFREALRDLWAARGSVPISKAPTLSDLFYGIGTRLYGRGDWDPETATYVATLFFTILYLPIIALARYRVEDLANGRIRFYGKVPLTRNQRIWNLVVAFAVLVLVSAAVIGGQGATPSAPSPAFVAGPASPVPITTPTRDSAMGEEIQRRRSEIQIAKSALDQARQAIDVERAALTTLRLQIEQRRSQYPDGLPPSVYAIAEREVAEHNKRVKAWRKRVGNYNARLERVKQDVAELDALQDQHNSGR
jgi:hypothetical protein